MDETIRELERRAAQGDPEAREQLEQALRRAGLRPVLLPGLGPGNDQALVAEWYVGPGDVVRKDQVIAMLELDKVSVELTAPEDGVVAGIEVQAGDGAPVGCAFARLGPAPAADPALEARHASLLRAVAAAPGDPAARLAYAGFLRQAAARGQGVGPWGRETTALRGELIEVHQQNGGALGGELAQRLRALLPRVERTALDLVPGEVRGAWLEGGFLAGVDAAASWITARWGELVEVAPLIALGISDLREAAPLLALPRLEQVRSLALGPRVDPGALAALAAAGRLRPRRLVLREVDPLPALAALGAVELALHGRVPPSWLAGSSVLHLELHLRLSGPEAFRALAHAVPPSVRELSARVQVGAEVLGEAAVAELVGPRFVPLGPGRRPW